MTTRTGDTPRVLVAEDDPALRRLLELRLAVSDYDIRSAEDGAVAVATALEWRPDILICDVMMPRMSGLTVCKTLRSDESFAAMPIILLTARVFDEDIEQVMALGGIGFMNKPFNLDELTRAIATALAGDIEEGIPGSDRLGWLRKTPHPVPTNPATAG